ncbi:ankyrin repeat domain-containing protein [Legionella gresilensis]|uniref:ankyrin repeat domain-containing protein n=1 Tax=Legionella gresilensis TaxID=91823 RepID=UPI0010414735|nr:ankyrin repeat domain-containing protein [Legionella gresilensis]
MTIKEFENTINKDLLNSLGVSYNLSLYHLNKSDNIRLYRRLYPPVGTISTTPLKINQLWQVYLLTGRLDLISKLNYKLTSDLMDNWGARVVHYAAWSAILELLDSIKQLAPELLTLKDDHGRTIAHYAALSGNLEALNWIKVNTPELLGIRSNYGRTIAHYAAISGHPAQLNLALALSKTPERFNIDIFRLLHPNTQIKSLQTISKMLENNLTLTTIFFPDNINSAIKNEITMKLSINKALPSLIQVVIGFYEKGSQFYCVPHAILLEIISHLFPTNCLNSKIQFVLEKLMTYLEPNHWVTNKVKNKIIHSIDSEIVRLSASQSGSFFNLIQQSDHKIKILDNIRATVNRNHNSLDELKKTVVEAFLPYQDELKHQRNYLHSLFKPDHSSKSFNIVETCYKLLNINPEINFQALDFNQGF